MVELVKAGQRITAESINQIIRPLQSFPTIHAGSAGGQQAAGIVTFAENVGATVLDQFAVCLINGQVHQDSDAPQERPNISTQVALPSAAVNLDFIAVAQRQILVNDQGLVCLLGVCWAKYDGSTGDRGSAVEGSDELTLSDTGPAEVLALNATDGLALVRFGGGAAGGASIAHSHTTEDWGFVPSWFGN